MKRAKAILKKELKDLDYSIPRPARVYERCPDTAQAGPWNKTGPGNGSAQRWNFIHNKDNTAVSEGRGTFQQRYCAREPHGKRNCDL